MRRAFVASFALLAWLNLCAAPAALDRLIDFQQYRFGLPPTEFDFDATGPHGPVLVAGRPLWRVYVDLFAPSPKLVLIQSSTLVETNHFPIALLRDARAESVKLAVSFKLLGGELTRSAGLLWHAQDKDNYSALLVSGNGAIRLLRMSGGRPAELTAAKTSFDDKEWHVLEVAVQREAVSAWLDDRLVLETGNPNRITVGRVGLITHADTTALFDDFYVQTGGGRVLRKPQP
jgi:hypothetical protein